MSQIAHCDLFLDLKLQQQPQMYLGMIQKVENSLAELWAGPKAGRWLARNQMPCV